MYEFNARLRRNKWTCTKLILKEGYLMINQSKTLKNISGGVCAPNGFLASGIHCGIRKNKSKKDLAIIFSEVPCSAASVYTLNKVQGAPIAVTKKHLENGTAQGILCNSGKANTCNADGVEIAKKMCELAADATTLSAQDFIVASTGVIGQSLPIAPFIEGVPQAVSLLEHSPEACLDAANAIMTTDTKVKQLAFEFVLGGKTCHIGAIGKGSGMIHPNMATMLIFITTDVAISPAYLQKALSTATHTTFNQISVDGDTSTNDMVSVLANGMAENSLIDSENEDYAVFFGALHSICLEMSRCIAGDGEGATKLLECKVTGAPSDEIALAVSKSVISSSLLKAAMFASDANWGRILCAIGYTPGDFSIDQVSVTIKSSEGEVLVCQNAAHVPYSEEHATKVLSQPEVLLDISMGDGTGEGTAWGCDLTYDYVKINADYRS